MPRRAVRATTKNSSKPGICRSSGAGHGRARVRSGPDSRPQRRLPESRHRPGLLRLSRVASRLGSVGLVVRRGEIWWADLGSPRGSAPALRRPFLVISADFVNRSALRTVSVVGLTANVKWAGAPGNVLIASSVAGLGRNSVANVTQLQTIDRADLDSRVGKLPRALMQDVDSGLQRILDL